MKIEIKVKQKHIKHGVAGSCGKCPVALAVIERLGLTATDVVRVSDELFVSRGKHDFQSGYLRLRATLPSKAKAFINKFDLGIEVKPFTFQVTI